MSVTPQGIKAALIAFRDAKDGKVVNEAELRRRFAICSACPQKRLSSSILTKMSKVLGQIANSRKVPRDIKDYSCGVCSCSFMLLLPSLTPHKDSPEEAAKRPDHCWMKNLP